MGANFTLIPTRVIPLTPKWNTLITQSEGMKKQYQSLTDTPEEKFLLIFVKMSDANYLTLLDHYNDCQGGYDSFSWQSVPSYIDTNRDGAADGSNMTGRWEENSLSRPVINAYDVGDIEIIFVKAI